MKIKHIGKIIFKCAALLLLVIIIGAALITAVNYLPVNKETQQESFTQLSNEGWFPEVPSMAGEFGSFHSMNPTALELATDNLMIKTALYDGEDSGLIQAFRNFSTHYNDEYSRYWHGYVVVQRFLLMFFNYYEIRIINGICQLLIFCTALHFILKYKGIKYGFALATSYILLMPMALAQCFFYSSVYYVAFGALLIYLKFKTNLELRERYIYFFLVLGAVTTYLDLLTYPMLTWGLVIIWWILLQEKKESIVGYVLKVIFSAVAWVMGYAVMWAGKWAIGSIILRENLFESAFSETLKWTVNEGENAITFSDRLQALLVNWEMYAYKLYLVIMIAWVLYAVIRGIWRYVKDSRTPALLLVGCSSFVWYMVVAGQTSMHHIFAHRTFGVSIAAFMGIVLVSTAGKPEKLSVKRLLANYAVIALSGGIALLLTLQPRFDFIVNNYPYVYDKVLVDDTIYMSFVPSFARIKNIRFGISSEGDKSGEYRISLLDGEQIVYEKDIPVYEWSEGNLHDLPVDWKLTAGKQYKLKIDFLRTDSNTYLLVTQGGLTPLSEYGEISIGEKVITGQMLTEINYFCRPLGKFNLAFWFTSFMAVCLMVIAPFYNFDKRNHMEMTV